jgi:hypothetical protein
MDYAALKAEIGRPDYAGLSDEQIAAALNAPYPRVVDVSARAVRAVLTKRGGAWFKVGIASASATADMCWAAARMLYDAQREGQEGQLFGTSDPDILAGISLGLSAMVGNGVLTDGDVKAVLDLAKGTTTRAAELGWERDINPGDVAAARIFANG